jgi:predicted Rossmann fold nucleotide-binding protein DprA/Smf involved in DNA uptake
MYSNRFLVEHASTLLAIYNGARRSGTGSTVNYARKMGREIIVIDPITRLITHDETAPSPAQS